MSGVIGLIGFGEQASSMEAGLRQALCRFSWTTWDWWLHPSLALAMGRVDNGLLGPDRPPVASQDGQVVVIFSGELYRTGELFAELHHTGLSTTSASDPELVLSAYLEMGTDAFSRLEGVYHLALYDGRQDRVYLTNDRHGLLPLYWARYGSKFVFGPEVKVVLQDKSFEKRLNHTALAEYVRFQQLLESKTFFEGISLLPPASILSVNLCDNEVNIAPYWSFGQIAPVKESVDFREAVQEAARLFQAAVDRQSEGDLRAAVLLSGGLDSRLVAGCLAKRHSGFPTMTYGQRNTVDVELARRVAKVVGSRHQWMEMTDGQWILDFVDLHLEQTEGFHSWVHCHGISMLDRVREVMDANLSGHEVGTGLGGGFYRPGLHDAEDETAFNCSLFQAFAHEYTWPGLDEAEAVALWADPWRETLRDLAYESLVKESRALSSHSYYRRADLMILLQHTRRLTANYAVFGGSHIVYRYPAMDYQFLDFAYSLPAECKDHRRLQKAVVQAIDPRLADIPNAKDGLIFTDRRMRRVAQFAAVRIKQRINRHIRPVFNEPFPLYADYETWLRTDLRPWAEGLLLDGSLASRGYLNPDTVRSLFNLHMSGRRLHTIGKIASLMTFEMMMRRYFD